jgi:curved DNA-binding protein CbpA
VLELGSDAGERQIKDAYRVLVKVWHPDRFQEDKKLRAAAEEKLKALNAAYIFLTANTRKSNRRPQAGQPPHRPAASVRNQAAPRAAARRWRLMPSPALLVGFGTVACAMLIATLAFKSVDSSLASDPTIGGMYSELRSGVAGAFRQAVRTVWSGAEQHASDLLPRRSASAAAANPQPVDAAQPATPANLQPDAISQNLHRRELGAAHAAPAKLMPYITVGLTKDEVIAIQGAPTAAADGKLVYGGSELYLTDGKVSGWKIDSASAQVRVKLWPDAPVDPDLDSFGVGSSKNVVLVVEGTPTYFSENKFGYGSSEVNFQNGRVVSWKNDPAWPLRTAPRQSP